MREPIQKNPKDRLTNIVNNSYQDVSSAIQKGYEIIQAHQDVRDRESSGKLSERDAAEQRADINNRYRGQALVTILYLEQNQKKCKDQPEADGLKDCLTKLKEDYSLYSKNLSRDQMKNMIENDLFAN